jgi:hypothetical protein
MKNRIRSRVVVTPVTAWIEEHADSESKSAMARPRVRRRFVVGIPLQCPDQPPLLLQRNGQRSLCPEHVIVFVLQPLTPERVVESLHVQLCVLQSVPCVQGSPGFPSPCDASAPASFPAGGGALPSDPASVDDEASDDAEASE